LVNQRRFRFRITVSNSGEGLNNDIPENGAA
jgi:hypothetical protein